MSKLSSEEHVKVLDTLLKIIREDNAAVSREVFRAKLEYFIKGVLLEVVEKK